MNNFISKFINELLDIIYPEKCIVCKNIIDKRYYELEKYEAIGICRNCIELFHIFDKDICVNNFLKNNGFSMMLYTEQIKNIIHKFKYDDYGYYARVMGRAMGKFFLKQDLFDADFIIPVPIHRKRKRQRGFNQVDIMAYEMSKIVKIPVLKNVLIRYKYTEPLFKMDKSMRIKNVEGAFQIKNPDVLLNKNILIIDDIYTTGTTINECIKTLKKVNIKNAYFFTLSSTKEMLINSN